MAKAPHPYIVEHRPAQRWEYYFGSERRAMAVSVAENLKRSGRACRILERGKIIEEYAGK